MYKRRKRKDLYNGRYVRGLCMYCGKFPYKENRKGCETCLNKKVTVNNKYAKNSKNKISQSRLLLKYNVIEKYGGECACCKENQMLFLTIDHINNDGNLDRIRTYGSRNISTNSWYLKLRREKKRNDLQVLCFNCNIGKSINGGICPHIHSNRILSPIYDQRHNSQFDVRLKIVWPTDDDLLEMCNKLSVSQVAKYLNVGFASVSRRLKRRNKYHLVRKKSGGIKIGSDNPSSKLTDSEVTNINNYYKLGISRKELSEKYKVSRSLIDKIVTKQLWKHLIDDQI